ncbi:hypothetical protein ACOME3_005284 [Neoechinorhynchus agilis]
MESMSTDQINEICEMSIRNALASGHVLLGLRQVVKMLDRRQGLFCILAKNCDHQGITSLVQALCKEHGVKLLMVDDNKKLGEWAGLCKFDREGKARKVRACSVLLIMDHGVENEYVNQLTALVQ